MTEPTDEVPTVVDEPEPDEDEVLDMRASVGFAMRTNRCGTGYVRLRRTAHPTSRDSPQPRSVRLSAKPHRCWSTLKTSGARMRRRNRSSSTANFTRSSATESVRPPKRSSRASHIWPGHRAHHRRAIDQSKDCAQALCPRRSRSQPPGQARCAGTRLVPRRTGPGAPAPNIFAPGRRHRATLTVPVDTFAVFARLPRSFTWQCPPLPAAQF
jgi:hypothetical protein